MKTIQYSNLHVCKFNFCYNTNKKNVCFACGCLHIIVAELSTLKKIICPTGPKIVTFWYLTNSSFLRTESVTANIEVYFYIWYVFQKLCIYQFVGKWRFFAISLLCALYIYITYIYIYICYKTI